MHQAGAGDTFVTKSKKDLKMKSDFNYYLVNFCSVDVDSGTNIAMVFVCLNQREDTQG